MKDGEGIVLVEQCSVRVDNKYSEISDKVV